MREDERVWAVSQLLSDYVASPSLRHIRDPRSVHHLAQEIVRRIAQHEGIWRKWDSERETLLKSALGCWVPVPDMREFLNRMAGPSLTVTDVAMRLKAFEEEYHEYPVDEFQSGCLAIYEREKREGTELPAIVQLLREHIESETDRIHIEQQQRYQRWREEDRISREQRLFSGADCKWTQLRGSPNWFCRSNGRTYRLSPTKDKTWNLHRISSVSDADEGELVGRYRTRGAATKVVAEVAYRPD